MQIRHRHLGGGREKQIVLGAVVLLIGEFRQLRGADQRLAMHQERRQDLGVAVLARVQVEQEIDQRALQPRARPAVNDERAAGDLRGAFEIQNP